MSNGSWVCLARLSAFLEVYPSAWRYGRCAFRAMGLHEMHTNYYHGGRGWTHSMRRQTSRAESQTPSKTVGSRTAQLLTALYESGQTTFTHGDVANITNLPAASARSLIRHAVARGIVSRLEPGLFVLVPPELAAPRNSPAIHMLSPGNWQQARTTSSLTHRPWSCTAWSRSRSS